MFGTQKREETESLARTRWNCKYHIVFAPKYRRQAIYGELRVDIGGILRKLCGYKGVEIIEAETCPDCVCQQKSCAKGHEKVVQCQHGQVFWGGRTACKNAKVLVLRDAKSMVSMKHCERGRGEVLNFWCSF